MKSWCISLKGLFLYQKKTNHRFFFLLSGCFSLLYNIYEIQHITESTLCVLQYIQVITTVKEQWRSTDWATIIWNMEVIEDVRCISVITFQNLCNKNRFFCNNIDFLLDKNVCYQKNYRLLLWGNMLLIPNNWLSLREFFFTLFHQYSMPKTPLVCRC